MILDVTRSGNFTLGTDLAWVTYTVLSLSNSEIFFPLKLLRLWHRFFKWKWHLEILFVFLLYLKERPCLVSQVNLPARWVTFVCLLEDMNVVCRMGSWDDVLGGGLSLSCALLPHSRPQRFTVDKRKKLMLLLRGKPFSFCQEVGEHLFLGRRAWPNKLVMLLCMPVFRIESVSTLHAYFSLTNSDFVTWCHVMTQFYCSIVL